MITKVDIITEEFKKQSIEIQNKGFIKLFSESSNILNDLEIFKTKAIQDYLLSRGQNDEEINDKLRELIKLQS